MPIVSSIGIQGPTGGSTNSNSVKSYGALGDGVTDDSAAIATAIALGDIYFPPATSYRISSNLAITTQANFATGAMLLVDSGKTVTFSHTPIAARDQQIFSGSGTIAFTTNVSGVYPDWWGSGNTAVQSAVTAAGGTCPIYLLPKRYTLNSASSVGLSISTAGTYIEGLGSVGDCVTTTTGPELYYAGTGKALQVGVGVDTTSTVFTTGTQLHNFAIKTADACTVGLHAWAPSQAVFDRLTIFGPSGSSSYLIKVNQGINTTFKNIKANGTGYLGTATQANYANGIAVQAISGSPTTTTNLDTVYLHGCGTCLSVDTSFLNAKDTICETSLRGFQVSNSSLLQFSGLSWFENCGLGVNEGCGYVSGGCKVVMENANIVIYTGTTLAFVVQSLGKLFCNSLRVGGTSPSTYVFNNSTTPAGAVIQIGDLQLSGTAALNNPASPANETPNWLSAKILGQKVEKYTFIKPVVAANATITMPIDNGFSSSSFIVPTGGYVLGLNSYYASSISSGTCSITCFKNGSTSLLATGAVSSLPVTLNVGALSNSVSAGDAITVQLSTTSSFASTGYPLITEIFVGY